MVIIRYLFAILLGFLAGFGTAVWLLQSGSGDFFIRKTEVVQDLEKRVREMEQERDRLARRLEDVASRMERMQGSYDDLTRRFRDVSEARTPPPSPPSHPAPPAPEAAGDAPAATP